MFEGMLEWENEERFKRNESITKHPESRYDGHEHKNSLYTGDKPFLSAFSVRIIELLAAIQ